METNPSGNDPKSIWQNQPAEASKVTMEFIRQRARDLHARTRWDLFNSAISHAIAFIFCIVGAVLSHNAGQRIAYAVGVVYTLAAVFVIHRGMWTAPMPGDAGFATGIEFCRKEIERRQAIFSRGLSWIAGPMIYAVAAYLVPAIAASIKANPNASPKVLINAVPFFALLTLWAVAVFFIRIRQRQALQREMDDLDAIEKENR